MPYSDALIQHINALEFLDLPAAVHVATRNQRAALSFYGSSASPQDMLRMERDVLSHAETFYMEQPIQDLLRLSQATFPRDVPIGDIGFPYPCGFLCFATPIDAPYHPDPSIGKWLGFVWSSLDRFVNRWPDAHPTIPDGPVVHISYYHEDLGRNNRPILVSTHIWPYGDSLGTWETVSSTQFPGIEGPQCRPTYSFVAVCLAWLTQRLMRLETVDASRPVRRGLQRKGYHLVDALVNRIILRPIDGPSRQKTDKTQVDWGCQWIVRSHWRKQYYARERMNRAIWVLSHVKGPSDKPLKIQQPVVFDIAR